VTLSEVTAGGGFDWAQASAFAALMVSLLILAKQAFDLLRGRKKEALDIQEALEQQPLVREQLALGNVDKATAILNEIIASQAKHIQGQDARIARLEEHNDALETESEGWQSRYRELEEAHAALEARCDDMEATLIRLQRPQ
jgi:hypothetical protein